MTSIIPAPKQISETAGVFDWNGEQPITVGLKVDALSLPGYSTDECRDWLVQFCQRSMFDRVGIPFEMVSGTDAAVQLELRPDLPPEGYELTIQSRGIRIAASENIIAGWQAGLMSLFQLLWDAKREGRSSLPAVVITDWPEFSWRGLHLDVCRHFFDINFVKRILDLMAIHRLNRFHWHLTEDQGWRLEVPSLPKLAAIAAWREQGGKRYGGFYSREQVLEVIEYAAARGIQVVPEIELPGHSVAALAAYPELACQPREFAVETDWGVFEDVYCAGNEATFGFLQEVMDYVIELFPGDVIHIGGDECPKTRWKTCSKCQARIKAEGLRDEEHLQSYFVGRMVNYLASRGRRAIGWDEILEGGLADGAMVMSWRGHEGGIAAARMGHDVVMAPTSHCYFDFRQSDDPAEMGFHGVNTLRDVFDFQPVPAELSPHEARYVLGGQANVWTERQLHKEENVEYMIVPRICALAEVLWGRAESAADWNDFLRRLPGHFELLLKLGFRGRPLD